jgi:hypothetical protein
MPPQLQQVPSLEDSELEEPAVSVIGGAPSRELASVIRVLDPASAASGAPGASTTTSDNAIAAADSTAPPDAAAPGAEAGAQAPSGGPSPVKKLAVLPGNPAFVGGFGSEHPNVAIFAMGDGSIKALTRGMSGKVLQAMAHKSDGKLDNTW